MNLGSYRERMRSWLGTFARKRPRANAEPQRLPAAGAPPQRGEALSLRDAIDRVYALRDEADPDEVARADQVRAVLQTVPAKAWARLVRNERGPSHGSYGVQPSHARRLASFPDEIAVELLGVLTFMQSGYVREAALRAIAKTGRSEGLRYVLPRLGDWVPQVRQAAEDALEGLLERPLAASVLLEHFRLIEALRLVRRVDLSEARERILAFLRTLRGGASMCDALTSRDAAMRVFAHEVFLDEVRGSRERVEALLRDRNPGMRAWFLRKILAGTIALDEAQYRRALRAQSSRFVSSLIRALPDARLADFEGELVEASMSDARSVREAARFRLRGRGGLELQKLARARLDETDFDAVWAGLIAALTDVPGELSYERGLVFLDHPSPRVRSQTVRGLARLDATRAAKDAVVLLGDESGRVRRCAVAVATSGIATDWLPRAQALLEDDDESLQLTGLRCFEALERWQRLPGLLRALQIENARVRRRAWYGLDAWWREWRSRTWLETPADARREVEPIWSSARTTRDVPTWAQDSWRALSHALDEICDT